ncbi:hypothetical protein SAMN04489724_2387 [Algoriphagus locisalis]|uniref:Uncharacterized protein n=1 Tax=Algoriphagus locisalis TaxID=305507 RepID=A0A1I7BFV6_9BACT|nr:hypothetical protein [Algoriphagus locisalis]SFT86048.1 hypothetical protein SAMN04489724_2387 [Algoriphagus locisalis]
MKTIFKKLDKSSYLLLLFALFILFNFLLIYFMPKDYALDIRFAYSASEAFGVLNSMGQNLRKKYLLVIWLLDTPYLVVYLLLLVGLIRKLWKNKVLIYLPLAIVLLDFFENLMVTGLLLSFPSENMVLAYLASFFTTTKWVCVALCVVFLLTGLVKNYVLKNQPDLDLNG